MALRPTIAGAGAVVVFLVAFPAGAGGSRSFSDPPGDSGTAPDVTTVVVSNDDRGVITFALTFANRTSLVGDDRVVIALDVDRSELTGSYGVDYLIVSDNLRGVVRLARWTGAIFDVYIGETLRAVDWKTFTVDRTELNGTSAFDFLVQTGTPAGFAGPHEEAPDGGAAWTYELQLAPVREVSLEVDATFKPAAPIAGKPFAVTQATLAVSTRETIRLAALSCRATIAGKPLRPPGRCAWRIPKAARAKTLVVTITGGYEGDRIVSDPYRFRIR